ncbi:MAG: ErfK/YbiS/YcfS/YnhG family protein [Hyphomicrobiales bacterium]|nr:ErfK/YbiS/YcfS/YnhG family protein [Hyphomicrobiales bacterium]
MLRRMILSMLFVLFASPVFAAGVTVVVNISTQTMSVNVDGVDEYQWAVSTGRKGHRTPVGQWHPTRLEVKHYSKKYDNAPMPHSIFFTGGYAIHCTYQLRALGGPASHGCVRLHPENAALLYDIVSQYGAAQTTIQIRT